LSQVYFSVKQLDLYTGLNKMTEVRL